MKRTMIAIAMAISVVGCWTLSQAGEVTSQNVVGYYKIALQTNRLNFIAVPMQKIPVYRGTITANTSNTITDADAASYWAANDYRTNSSGKETYGNSTFYIQFAGTNGSFYEGQHYTISSNTETKLVLSSVMDPLITDNLLVGAKYSIVPHNRVRDLFGEAASTPLKGAILSNSTNKDEIVMWGGASWLGAIWAKTNSPVGWRRGPTTAADDIVIDRDDALFVRMRMNNPAVELTVTGEVLPHNQQIVVDQGMNLVNGGVVTDVQIANSGLSNSFNGAALSNSTNKDEVLEWGGASWLGAMWYKTNSPVGWRRGPTTVVNTNLLRAGNAYFIRRRGDAGFNWNRPSPLQ